MTMQLDVSNLHLVSGEDKMGHMLIALKNALVAKGYTVVGSGDGLSAYERQGDTAGPSYDVFTASPQPWAIGEASWDSNIANSISNNYAWMILKEPSPSTRELVIQRSTSTSATQMFYLYTIRWATNGFETTGCSATTVNITGKAGGTVIGIFATANTLAFGNGTAESISSTDDYYAHIWVSDTARAGNVWPWYMSAWNAFDGNRGGEWVYESLLNCPGSDPFVFKCSYGTNTSGSPASSSMITSWNLIDESSLLANAGYMTMYYPASTTYNFPGNFSQVVAADGKVRSLPCIFFSSTFVFKGIAEHILLNPRNRDYPATQDLTTTSARICLGALSFPWEQNLVPNF